MNDFFTALSEQNFLQSALIAGILASIGCGVMGTYVVVKRIAFLAGGIAHSVLGGMGAAVYYGFEPLAGALVAAIVAALLIGWVRLKMANSGRYPDWCSLGNWYVCGHFVYYQNARLSNRLTELSFR